MKKSTVYHVMTRPDLFAGLPKDFAIVAFVMSVGVGGAAGFFYFGNGFGALVGTAPIALIFWVIGFFMTKRDPEFFTVWWRSCFLIGDTVNLEGKRDYEP